MTAQPKDIAQELIDAMAALAAVLLRESDLLRRMKVSETAALKPSKEALTERYAALALAVRRDPQALTRLAPARRAALAAVAKGFAEVAQANERAVKGAQDANEMLFRTIAQALGAADGSAQPYTRGGKAPAMRSSAGTRPVSLNARL
jgi:hypothetical protein